MDGGEEAGEEEMEGIMSGEVGGDVAGEESADEDGAESADEDGVVELMVALLDVAVAVGRKSGVCSGVVVVCCLLGERLVYRHCCLWLSELLTPLLFYKWLTFYWQR